MVAYLDKSTENADFDEIVDFLNANPIRYALTVSPTIYVSNIEQFWFITKTKTVNNETQIHAKVDGKTIVITGSSVRRDLYINDEDGTATPLFATMLIQAVEGEGLGQPTKPQHIPTTALPSYVEPIPTIASSSHLKKTHKHQTIHEERRDSMERAATTAISLDAEQGSVNTLGIGKDGMKLNELMEICIKWFERVLALENIKTAQGLEITNLKKRVKKLEKKKMLRTPQLKRRLFKVRIESSAEKSLGDQEDATSITSASINITNAEPVITASAPVATASVYTNKRSDYEEASETATRPIVPPQQQLIIPPQQQLDPKDKGKGIMQGPKKPVKVKGKDQIEYDIDMAKRLQV
ncbi:hypothetical protein Tco_1183737 [Tanacetum coccineum]